MSLHLGSATPAEPTPIATDDSVAELVRKSRGFLVTAAALHESKAQPDDDAFSTRQGDLHGRTQGEHNSRVGGGCKRHCRVEETGGGNPHAK